MIKKTNQYFLNQVVNLVGEEYTFLQSYINADTSIFVRHNKCGNEYKVTPNHFLQGTRCPSCSVKVASKKKTKTTNTYKKEVFEKVGGEYEVLGEYVNTNAHITMKHVSCGHVYDVTPNHFLNTNRRCPLCYKNIRFTKEQLIEKIMQILGDSYSIPDFLHKPGDGGIFKKINIFHKTCGKTSSVRIDLILYNYHGCSYCNLSSGEQFISKWLDERNIVYKQQVSFEKCKNINVLYFDFQIFLEDGSFVLIEYDGVQHFKPSFSDIEAFNRTKQRDAIKDNFCKTNKIDLLRISYKDIQNIDKILKDKFEERSTTIP